jgi:hypothetical protein
MPGVSNFGGKFVQMTCVIFLCSAQLSISWMRGVLTGSPFDQEAVQSDGHPSRL